MSRLELARFTRQFVRLSFVRLSFVRLSECSDGFELFETSKLELAREPRAPSTAIEPSFEVSRLVLTTSSDEVSCLPTSNTFAFVGIFGSSRTRLDELESLFPALLLAPAPTAAWFTVEMSPVEMSLLAATADVLIGTLLTFSSSAVA
jgi:hypothetical protein